MAYILGRERVMDMHFSQKLQEQKSEELERLTEVFHELDPRNKILREIENFIKVELRKQKNLELLERLPEVFLELKQRNKVMHELKQRNKIFRREIENFIKERRELFQKWEQRLEELNGLLEKSQELERLTEVFHELDLRNVCFWWEIRNFIKEHRELFQEREKKYQEIRRLRGCQCNRRRFVHKLRQTEQAVKQSHCEREAERESFRLDNERLMLLLQRMTEKVKTLEQEIEEEKYKRIKAEERSQHLSELQEQKDQEVERLTEVHLKLNLRNKSFQQEIENLTKERQELFGALRKLFESQNILQQRIEKLVEESQGTSEQMRQTFQEVEQTKLELKAEYESLRLEKERWSDERMTDVEKILGQKLDEQIRERTKAEEISRYLLEENCQLNARVKELMSRQAELAEVSCSTPSPDTVQENLVESNNDLTIGEANEESD